MSMFPWLFRDESARAMRVVSAIKNTYRAAGADVVVPAGTQPFFVIAGSATKKIAVQRIIVSGVTLTAVAYATIIANKCSTAISGGTPSALTAVPLDSAFATTAPATASLVQMYTAAPTTGTIIGKIGARRQIMQATTAAAAGIPGEFLFDFRTRDENGPGVLRGVAENIVLAFASAPATTPTMSLEVEWIEESL